MTYFLDTFCSTLEPVIKLIKAVLALVKFGIPIVLIVLGTIDLGKAVMASKDDEMKKAQGVLIKRVVYAVVIFLLVTIVELVMNLVSTNSDPDASNWFKCWTETTTSSSAE